MSGSPLGNDASTQLLLRFDNSAAGVAGEAATASAGTSYGVGQVGQAIATASPGYIRYDTASNITSTAGTVEFWIRPTWNGNAGVGRTFFSVGQSFNDGMLLSIDGANNLRFIQWGDDPTTPTVETSVERGAGASGATWVAGTWYHVAATWDSTAHTLAYYVNGQLQDSASNAVTLPSFSTNYLEIGSAIDHSQPATSSFDELRISLRARTAAEIQADYQLGLSGATLTAPTQQRGVDGNASVILKWTPIADAAGVFQNYRIYRSTSAFTSVAGLSPIATVSNINATGYTDATAANGTTYYYAVTSAGTGGVTSGDSVTPVGPRRPRNETDLQVVSVSRAIQYPRYQPTYTSYTITEPSGFGPYLTGAATGLSAGQTASTQHLPNVGESTTYNAVVRNRGTNTFSATVAGTFTLDGATVATQNLALNLAPGQTATFTYTRTWDGQSHELDFHINAADARPANNTLNSDTMAVAYLTYLDQSFVEDFRDKWSVLYPGANTDDLIDWLNQHMTRFNQLFAAAGTQKRVGYGVLQVIDDTAADPTLDTSPYAIFPFRYRTGVDSDPRAVSAYYSSADDIDYGILHEIGHQLGLIDEYQVAVDGSSNLVSGLSYSPGPGLMNDVSHFLSADSAAAMTHWLNVGHGYFGQYLYSLPSTMNLRILGSDGNPLSGATITVYQKTNVPNVGPEITTQAKAQGTTDASGIYTLPNVAIDAAKFPETAAGDQLHANPFGYLDSVGTNGLLHFKIQYGGRTAYAWLDVLEANVAYFNGQTATATFNRSVNLGGPVQSRPPIDMTENNASDWAASADGSTASATTDTARTLIGGSAVRFDTAGGFDTSFSYPAHALADWDLTAAQNLKFSAYAHNTNSPTFQNGSPWIKLTDINGNVEEFQYYTNSNITDLYSLNLDQWNSYTVPLNASTTTSTGWRRTQISGTSFDLSHVTSLDFHADTWGYGFSVWYDGVGFDLPTPAGSSVTIPGLPNPNAYAVRQETDGSIDVFADVPTSGSPNYHFAAGQLSSLTFAGGAGNASLTQLTALPFSPTLQGTGNDALNINAGVYVASSNLAADTPNLSVTVGSGASIQFNASQTLASLILVGSAAAVLQAGGTKLLSVKSLMLSSPSKLDLNDNVMIIDYATSSPRTGVMASLLTGRAGGAWNGSGINSHAAAVNTKHNTALGLLEATEYKSIYGTSALFGGISIDDTALLIKYALNGDTDFNGKVNADDYGRLDSGYQSQHNAGFLDDWFHGDFNYDFTINADDYALIDAAYQTQGVGSPRFPAPASTPGAIER